MADQTLHPSERHSVIDKLAVMRVAVSGGTLIKIVALCTYLHTLNHLSTRWFSLLQFEGQHTSKTVHRP